MHPDLGSFMVAPAAAEDSVMTGVDVQLAIDSLSGSEPPSGVAVGFNA